MTQPLQPSISILRSPSVAERSSAERSRTASTNSRVKRIRAVDAEGAWALMKRSTSSMAASLSALESSILWPGSSPVAWLTSSYGLPRRYCAALSQANIEAMTTMAWRQLACDRSPRNGAQPGVSGAAHTREIQRGRMCCKNAMKAPQSTIRICASVAFRHS